MSALTATALYGFDPTVQAPTASPIPDHQGSPEPTMATRAPAGKSQSPLVALLVLIGIVVVLTQVSFRGEIAVRG